MEEKIQHAILVGVAVNNDPHFNYSMKELKNLATACQVEVLGTLTQNLQQINPTHYIGNGKVEEVGQLVDQNEANLVIFNDELSPSQLRNLEQALQCKVIDRTLLILDIFATRAQTREAQLQVKIAQLKYMMPRLIGLDASLSRQAGGIGSKGPGEKKLELNRRRIEEKISSLDKELERLVATRKTQRKLRKRHAVPIVAIVGYTNAGKSTTMNAILGLSTNQSEKTVLEKNLLFSTLETLTRKIQLPDNKQFLLTDTVGFISKLPHQLIKAFRSTLEEVTEADLLLHIIDVSHPEHETQIQITNEVLKNLGVSNTPMIYVSNKADLIPNETSSVTDLIDSVSISAKYSYNINELLQQIKKQLFNNYVKTTLLIPYEQGSIVSYLNLHALVTKTQYLDEGTLLEVECSSHDYKQFSKYLY